MTSQSKRDITAWLTGANTCFLIGAGCSRHAEMPLIGDLTERVLKDATEPLLSHYASLRRTGDREATVEDLINSLVRHKEILRGTEEESRRRYPITLEEIDKLLPDIKNKIVSEINVGKKSSVPHKRFWRRILVASQNGPKDVFTLNYDTLIENSLDEECIAFVDGFRGSNPAWFDPSIFINSNADPEISLRLYKLHGSINWRRDESERVRRYLTTTDNTSSDNGENPDGRILIYPSEQKYIQTQYGVYETLLQKFRDRLRNSKDNNHLIILGYSFNDDHINEAICDSMKDQGNTLTLIAFVGPEDDRKSQDNRFRDLREHCGASGFDRFNALIGSGDTVTKIGNAFESNEEEVLKDELWKFENIVNFIDDGQKENEERQANG